MYDTPTYSLLTPHNSAELLQSFPHNVESLPFAQTMSYAANGRIANKVTNARILTGNHISIRSNSLSYNYAGGGNKVSVISDGANLFGRIKLDFRWDGCGNMLNTEISSDVMRQNYIRTHIWTEDNRLQTVADNSWFSYYQYDAAGDRTYKLTWSGPVQTVNGRRDVYYTPQSATLYVSPYLVATPQGYTKHYYAEAERITSQLGRGKFDGISTPVVSDSLVQVKLRRVTRSVRYPKTLTTPTTSYFAYLDTLTNKHNATSTLYFYHSDHLGSSSWVTNSSGTPVQHLHYLPWGEDYVNQRLNNFDGVRYTFSAKEKDAETGLSYFGSRYYSSDLSIWLSVDPQADKYPHQSNYVYCSNNPIRIIDPNGEDEWEFDECGNLNWVKETEFDSFHKIDKEGNRTGESLIFDRKIVSDRFDLGEDNESSYLRIVNANDADAVFSFLSDNVESSGAEFSNSMVQDHSGNIFNLIGSDKNAQVGKNYSIRNLLKSNDYTVLECTHNHYANKVSPSGPDVYWADKYPNTLFMIRTSNNYCTPYDRNTIPNYDYGTSSVIVPIKPIIIK